MGKVELSERAASHEHFIDLCRLIDEPTPASADATGEEYTFRWRRNDPAAPISPDTRPRPWSNWKKSPAGSIFSAGSSTTPTPSSRKKLENRSQATSQGVRRARRRAHRPLPAGEYRALPAARRPRRPLPHEGDVLPLRRGHRPAAGQDLHEDCPPIATGS